jgi:hypothetical protein
VVVDGFDVASREVLLEFGERGCRGTEVEGDPVKSDGILLCKSGGRTCAQHGCDKNGPMHKGFSGGVYHWRKSSGGNIQDRTISRELVATGSVISSM